MHEKAMKFLPVTVRKTIGRLLIRNGGIYKMKIIYLTIELIILKGAFDGC